MADSQKLLHPEVLWAQRKNEIYVTINLTDAKDPELNVTKEKITFKGLGGPDKKLYGFELDLLKEINPETSKRSISARQIFLMLDKAEHDQPYWVRLQKDKVKPAFLKTDFAKWKDEDEDEELDNPVAGMDYNDFGGPESGAFPYDDSDDDHTPDLEEIPDSSASIKQEEENITEEEKEANSVVEPK
jgi:hypothetical protein